MDKQSIEKKHQTLKEHNRLAINRDVDTAASSPEPQVVHFKRTPVSPKCYVFRSRKPYKKKDQSRNLEKQVVTRNHNIEPYKYPSFTLVCNEFDGPIIDQSHARSLPFTYQTRKTDKYLSVAVSYQDAFRSTATDCIEFPHQGGKAIYGGAFADGDFGVVLKVSPTARFDRGTTWKVFGGLDSALYEVQVTNEYISITICVGVLEYSVPISRETGRYKSLPA
ncbi:hypothetical protein BT63DRAFT_453546 [Microthyrium microscopicum]|uniref:Uncharacterized protein n=1 Tax=Microthyrium microscopicum TaxID=703497 RepID=A0A6A6UH72_9PEZI|nr:hypothetical protein BT63DRAFT_453546 [Microthyrium microscopicum]